MHLFDTDSKSMRGSGTVLMLIPCPCQIHVGVSLFKLEMTSGSMWGPDNDVMIIGCPCDSEINLEQNWNPCENLTDIPGTNACRNPGMCLKSLVSKHKNENE